MTARERLARLHLDLECNGGQPEAAALKLAIAVCDAAGDVVDSDGGRMPIAIANLTSTMRSYRKAAP